jgi:hypothetical protein
MEDPMSFAKTAVSGTKRVYKALESSATGAPREGHWIARGLRDSCEVFGDLLIDPSFLAFLSTKRRVLRHAAALEMLADYRTNREALDEFLAAERDLFIRAGLPESLSVQLVDRVRNVIQNPPSESVEISRGLEELRQYACGQADRIETGRHRGLLGGMFGAISGISIVALNGGLLAATGGMSGAQCGASSAAGGLVFGEGVNVVRRSR